MTQMQNYFTEELNYLNEAGSEFSLSFPELAAKLNMTSVGDRDPYIDRLFEGFAFLTSRIQKRLDDDLPEISENLLEMMAPEFLRPLPSMCMLKFSPRRGMLQNQLSLAKGTQVFSNPVGSELTPCEFRTACEVNLFPVELGSVTYQIDHQKGPAITFQFDFEKGLSTETFSEKSLKLFVSGEKSRALNWVAALTHKSAQIEVAVDGTMLPPMFQGTRLEAGGFASEEGLLTEEQSSLGSAGSLIEYFSFPEKFCFIDFKGFDFIKQQKAIATLSITIYSEQIRNLESENIQNIFQLFVTPAINLYECQAEPIDLNHRTFEYPVKLKGERKDIYQVENVMGVDKKTGKSKKYQNYAGSPSQMGNRFAYHRRQDFSGKWGGSLSVSLLSEQGFPSEEYLSVTVKATDGNLPRREIAVNEICTRSPEIPDVINVTNITRPSETQYPTQKKEYLWLVLNHMKTSIQSMSESDNLHKILELYSWFSVSSQNKIITELVSTDTQNKQFMRAGYCLRGIQVTLKFTDSFFQNEGEVLLAGNVLHLFFCRYITLNYMVSLRIVSETSAKERVWEPKGGLCQPL